MTRDTRTSSFTSRPDDTSVPSRYRDLNPPGNAPALPLFSSFYAVDAMIGSRTSCYYDIQIPSHSVLRLVSLIGF